MAAAGDEPARECRWRRAGLALGACIALGPLAAQAQVAVSTDTGSRADEPSTRASNVDLWLVPCAPQDDEADCPAWEGETEG